MNFIDLTGKKFNRLTVIERDGYIGKEIAWNCICDCGKNKRTTGDKLKRNTTKSCGCLNKEGSNFKHGYSVSEPKVYHAWKDMIDRCNNPNNKKYKIYGGRGIKVCKRWMKFENFLKDVGVPDKKMTLDRTDNNKNYSQNNFRWTTYKEQNRNKRNNYLITYNNKTQCLTDWANEYNMCKDTLKHRLSKLKWPIGKALITPVRKRKDNYGK
jgi:hypothetical protein